MTLESAERNGESYRTLRPSSRWTSRWQSLDDQGREEWLLLITYVAIGDSLTTGIGTWPGNGFVPQYQSLAEKALKTKIEVSNFGVPKATAGDVLRLLRENEDIGAKVLQANMITLTAGGNDLNNAGKIFLAQKDRRVLDRAFAKCRRDYSQIVWTIRQLKKGTRRPYMIRVVGLYNPSPQMPEIDEWIGKYRKLLKSMKYSNYAVADVYPLFLGREKELLYPNRIHPNVKGYRVMAEQLNRLGYKPLL